MYLVFINCLVVCFNFVMEKSIMIGILFYVLVWLVRERVLYDMKL